MTPDKSTMNKTERAFEEAINSSKECNSETGYSVQVNVQDATSKVYRLHRKECIEFCHWWMEQYDDVSTEEMFDAYQLKKDNITSSNEGNNEKE